MNSERIETVGERELAAYRAEIRTMAPGKVDLLSVEQGILDRLRVIGAEMMAEAMKRADTNSAAVIVDGEKCGSRRTSRGTYQTIFGSIVIERSVYQQAGRGRLTIPMDLRLSIVEGAYTPKLARILSHGVAVMTEEDAAGFVSEVGLATCSSSTFHRIPRAIAARYEANRSVLEAEIRGQDIIPDAAVTVQAGIDGVMVPQDGEHAMPRGRKTDSPSPPRHGVVDSGPAEHDGMLGRAWHEASVGPSGSSTPKVCDSRRSTWRACRNRARRPPSHCWRTSYSRCCANDQTSTWYLRAMARHRSGKRLGGSRVGFPKTSLVTRWISSTRFTSPNTCRMPPTRLRAPTRLQLASWRRRGERRSRRRMTEPIRFFDRCARVSPLSNRIVAAKSSRSQSTIQNEACRMNYAEALRRNYPIGTGITEAAAKTIAGVRSEASIVSAGLPLQFVACALQGSNEVGVREVPPTRLPRIHLDMWSAIVLSQFRDLFGP